MTSFLGAHSSYDDAEAMQAEVTKDRVREQLGSFLGCDNQIKAAALALKPVRAQKKEAGENLMELMVTHGIGEVCDSDSGSLVHLHQRTAKNGITKDHIKTRCDEWFDLGMGGGAEDLYAHITTPTTREVTSLRRKRPKVSRGDDDEEDESRE